VGDLGNDGELEVVAGTWTGGSAITPDVYVAMAYNTSSGAKAVRGEDRVPLPGRRVVGGSSVGQPVLADWDGDGVTEIIIGSDHGGLFCWEPVWSSSTETFALVPEKGWPILHREIQRSPAVADLDVDGFSELVVPTNDGYVHVYDLPGTTIVWGAAGYDLRRSGYVPPAGFGRPDAMDDLAAGPEGVRVGANPFREETRVRFRSVTSGPARVLVFDAAGRRVRTLLDAHSLEAGIHEVVWNGRDDAGASVPSGVYFGLVQTGEFEFKRRMVKMQ
jgi:hypothetical protein